MAKTPTPAAPDLASADTAPPAPIVDAAAKTADAPLMGEKLEAAQMALKRGTFEFAAPDYMGGSRITLAKGEPVPAALWPHISEADHDLFEAFTPAPVATDAPQA